jgi:hypothetical protein
MLRFLTLSTVISAFTDFVLALLPIHVIMVLQMKKIEKIRVAVAMSLGLLFVHSCLVWC